MLSPDEVFRLHPKIRWAALSSEGVVHFCEMRPGLASYTNEKDDRAFMELSPLFMTGLAERMSSSTAGKVDSIVVNLEHLAVMIMKVKEGYLAISTDRADAADTFMAIGPIIKTRFR